MTTRAILFLNLGGPETQADVKSFLYRLFEDPEVLRIKSTPVRKLLAWGIATARKKTSQAMYQKIGGGSPIRRLTDQQAEGVESLLKAERRDAWVRTAFNCSTPLVENVIHDLYESGVRKFLAFPLYPQYSLTTTKGAHDRVRSALKKYPGVSLHEVSSWPTHPLFLKAHAEQIVAASALFSTPRQEEIHLLFSAHSIPEKLVTEEGDPYKDEMEMTVEGVVKESGWKGRYTLAWQSKLGPMKWLGPATRDVIVGLGKEGVKRVLVVPIAFVTDHIETLFELDQMIREEALAAGVKEYIRTPGLNNHPTFLKALVDIAKHQTDFWV